MVLILLSNFPAILHLQCLERHLIEKVNRFIHILNAFYCCLTDIFYVNITACSYAVPVTVNPGYYVQISGFSYDGSTTASVRAPTKFNAEHFFASSQGTKLDQAYTTSGDINIKYKGTVNSPCGGSFIFRINTGISAQGSNSMINVDKAFSYNVQSFPC